MCSPLDYTVLVDGEAQRRVIKKREIKTINYNTKGSKIAA